MTYRSTNFSFTLEFITMNVPENQEGKKVKGTRQLLAHADDENTYYRERKKNKLCGPE